MLAIVDELALVVDPNDIKHLPPLPKTYEEALAGEYRGEWREAAIKEEMKIHDGDENKARGVNL